MKIHSLEFRNLSFSYMPFPTKEDDFVFHNLNFLFPQEKVICFSGPTGAGKNTLLRILAGIDDPCSGEFLVNNINLFSKEEQERFTFRRSLGYGFSQGGLLQNRTIKENLLLALESLTSMKDEEREARVVEYMQLFHLSNVAGQRPSLISGGMRMAACLARAFVHDPELVILSNPTNGLSQSALDALLQTIQHHFSHKRLKRLFLVSEHESFLKNLTHQKINVSVNSLEAA